MSVIGHVNVNVNPSMDDYMGLENNGEDRNTSNITPHQEFYFYMQKSEKGQQVGLTLG